MQNRCLVIRAGRVPYPDMWKWQRKVAEEIGKGVLPPVLLLVEHPPTFTLGKSGKVEHLLWDELERKRRGIEIFWVDRGGDVTYHGPGQVVGYPLFPLFCKTQNQHSGDIPAIDVVGYVRKLEQALILTLKDFGVEGQRREGMSGVWVGKDGRAGADALRKIASIGVKVNASGVTYHGFALNLCTDDIYWKGIVACGLKGYQMTNLVELISPLPTLEKVHEKIISAMEKVFCMEMQEIQQDEPFDTISNSLYTIT